MHLQVAEELQNGLTFGSFDSNFVKELSSTYGASGGDDSDFKSSHGTGDDESDSSPTTNGIPAVASARLVTLLFDSYISMLWLFIYCSLCSDTLFPV